VKASKLKNLLEVVTNVAVLLVALVVLGTFAWSYFAAQPRQLPHVGLQKGKEFAAVAGVNYGDSSQTLLVAINTHCGYCKGSLPFYRQLIEANRKSGH
jgi:hypothetical protein